jgi:hypothetical protein
MGLIGKVKVPRFKTASAQATSGDYQSYKTTHGFSKTGALKA